MESFGKKLKKEQAKVLSPPCWMKMFFKCKEAVPAQLGIQ